MLYLNSFVFSQGGIYGVATWQECGILFNINININIFIQKVIIQIIPNPDKISIPILGTMCELIADCQFWSYIKVLFFTFQPISIEIMEKT